MTIWEYAAKDPDRIALTMAHSGRSLTFAELNERSLQARAVFREAGLSTGDAVAVYMENNDWYHAMYFGALRAGLLFVPVNRNLLPPEAAYIMRDSGAKIVVTSPAIATTDELGRLVPDLTVMSVGGDVPGARRFEDALAAIREISSVDDSPRGLPVFYSSGTTGRPKGIIRAISGSSYEDGMVFERFVSHTFGMDESTVYLSPGPLYHSAPLVYSSTAMEYGGRSVVMEKFDAGLALDLLERERVTVSQWVPTMFKRLLSLPEEVRAGRDLSAHRYALHAAAPIPVDIKQAMIEWWGETIVDIYGASENYGLALCTADEWRTHPGSIGKAIRGVPHIVGWDGEELPPGEVGRLFFEQPDDGFEYVNDPAKTEATRHPRHRTWRTVGDVGWMDEERFIYLTDRESHMIITGGVNIYPQEVEDALISHAMVLDAAIIGVPDDELGEIAVAVVVLHPGHAEHEARDELDTYLRKRFALFKVPRRYTFVPDLPRHDNGKLYKGRLKATHRMTAPGPSRARVGAPSATKPS